MPAWLPAPSGWTVATGAAYVAAGAALLANVLARLAAALATLQMGLFTLLVWIPAVAAGGGDEARSELFVSLALTAAAWVVAGSFDAGARSPGDACGRMR